MRLLNWFRRGRLEQGLDRELQYHFDRRVADFLASGLPEREARRRAGLELGGMTQVREEVRDVWLTRWLRDWMADLRYAARSFRRSPSFTAAAVLSLALGIGATAAIYSLVDQVILHSLPVRQPERLVLVDWKGDQLVGGFGSYNLMSYPMCRALQSQGQFFDGVLCRAMTRIALSTGGDARPVSAEVVSGSYFSVLGVGSAAGRVIEDADDAAPGASPVVVLSHDFWKGQLGGAMDVVGRKILVNQNPMTVVGVAAPEFHGIDVGEVPALWIPASMSAQAYPGNTDLTIRPTRWMQILGRLRPGLTAAQAQSGLQPWFKSLLDESMRRPEFPKVTPERRQRFLSSELSLTPAPQGHSSLRRSLSQPLWVLFGATGVLLGLACLNVAGLFLARGSARERELSTRVALGASRGRIGRQLLADSILLALAGGLLGVALAPVAMRALLAFMRDASPNALHAEIDGRLIIFALLVSLAAGILSGVAPAFHTGRQPLIGALRERGAAAPRGIRLRKAIVAAQIGFSLILVIGAGLFVRTLAGLLQKGPGFDTSRLIYFNIDPRKNGYSPEDASRLVHRIHAAIRASSFSQASAVARFAFLHGGSWNDPVTILAGGRIVSDRDVNLNAVTPGFFAAMGVRIVAGRDFDEHDADPGAKTGRRTAIVNEAFVKRYLGGRSPLGILICEGSGPDARPDIEVVGVASDFNYRGLREQSEQVFFPLGDGFAGGGNVYVKIRGNREDAYRQIRAIVRKADPGLPINFLRTVDEQMNHSLNNERLLAMLSTAFGLLALVLSLVGLYGVMSYVVTRRTPEIGIRMALGASAGSAVWLVLRDAVIMIAAGLAIALPFVSALGKLVESQLFGVTATDPLTIAEAALLLAAASLGAALIPAWQATRVNPIDALRLD